jgi:hypothetical protein
MRGQSEIWIWQNEWLTVKLSRCAKYSAETDEDINTSATIIPSIEIVGPITRSREQQLNH